jgi:chaperonin GroES
MLKGKDAEKRILNDYMPRKKNILPINDKVCVKRDESPEKIGLIWVPPSKASEPPMSGTVVSIGPDVVYIRPGDRVVFGQYTGTNIKIDGMAYTVLLEKDIHIVVENKENKENKKNKENKEQRE